MGKNCLVIGSGGREHAICWKLSQSPAVENLYCAPGNGGISSVAQIVDIKPSDFEGVASFCKEKGVSLVVVGPEQPLVDGIADFLRAQGIAVCGPDKAAARLEGSKVWAKEFMKRHGIPTAEYEIFSDPNAAKAYIEGCSDYPIVIKADGLAAGKGVIIAKDKNGALTAIEDVMVKKAFGSAGDRVVIEKFLSGQEVSVIAVTDGEFICMLASSQDHKRRFDNDEGPNTGGMGAYSPAPILSYEVSKVIERDILQKTLNGLKEEGIVYKGIIYAGIILTEHGPFVLEYNVRLGDPEAQAILPRLNGDLFDLCFASATGGVNAVNVRWDKRHCIYIVAVASGYPGKYKKGEIIYGLDGIESDNLIVFHAGTVLGLDGHYRTSGGRVLGIAALDEDFASARAMCYDALTRIRFEGMDYRKDIGAAAMRLYAKGV